MKLNKQELNTLEYMVEVLHTLIAILTPYLYYATLVDPVLTPLSKLTLYLITLRMWSSDITCPLTHLQNYLRVQNGKPKIKSFPSYLITKYHKYLTQGINFLKNTRGKWRQIYKTNLEARRELKKGSPLYWYGKRQNIHSEGLQMAPRGILESLTTYFVDDIL